ncbi:hypothetical protein B0O80DRAFT_398578 [Mortierella sp. GBAus27b]|nr:hypothetical protein B0O80DRAFT_398578 [Mortierella sp. GBAus27b]
MSCRDPSLCMLGGVLATRPRNWTISRRTSRKSCAQARSSKWKASGAPRCLWPPRRMGRSESVSLMLVSTRLQKGRVGRYQTSSRSWMTSLGTSTTVAWMASKDTML